MAALNSTYIISSNLNSHLQTALASPETVVVCERDHKSQPEIVGFSIPLSRDELIDPKSVTDQETQAVAVF